VWSEVTSKWLRGEVTRYQTFGALLALTEWVTCHDGGCIRIHYAAAWRAWSMCGQFSLIITVSWANCLTVSFKTGTAHDISLPVCLRDFLTLGNKRRHSQLASLHRRKCTRANKSEKCAFEWQQNNHQTFLLHWSKLERYTDIIAALFTFSLMHLFPQKFEIKCSSGTGSNPVLKAPRNWSAVKTQMFKRL